MSKKKFKKFVDIFFATTVTLAIIMCMIVIANIRVSDGDTTTQYVETENDNE